MPMHRLSALFHTHHQRLYRLGRQMLSDPEEARDLVQETFLRAARHLHSIPAEESGAEAWLVRVLVNLCRDRHRKLAVRKKASDEAMPARSAEPSPDPEARAVIRSAVKSALASLSPRRRAVIVLHELQGLTVGDVAEILGLRQVTVRWHLAAARKQLAVLLCPDQGSTDQTGEKG